MIRAEWLPELGQLEVSVDRLLQQADTCHAAQDPRQWVAQRTGHSRQIVSGVGSVGKMPGYVQTNGEQDELGSAVSAGHCAQSGGGADWRRQGGLARAPALSACHLGSVPEPRAGARAGSPQLP